MLKLNVDNLKRAVADSDAFRSVGVLRSARGVLLASLPAGVGDLCEIQAQGGRRVLAEVIGLHEGCAQLLPYQQATGFRLGAPVFALNRKPSAPIGANLMGRVLDGLGNPVDGKGPLGLRAKKVLTTDAPQALDRPRIDQPLITGQRAIDGLLTIGQGQRVGLFSGSGVGKSTLLGEIAKGSSSDVNVIALVGERGREVRPFLDDCLGPEGLSRSVVIVSTSDQSPLMRIRAAQSAAAVADYFRSRGNNVLFFIDSLTRMATAQREIGLLLGEPPSSRGYTPSVFQTMATLLEQLGKTSQGSITSILSVLVDGDDTEEPVSDAVRSFVDGHIILDRKIAEQGRYPAINVARSISRTMTDVADGEHLQAAQKIRAIMATISEVEDLVKIGAYQRGAAPAVDLALSLGPAVDRFLKQEMNDRTPFSDTRNMMDQLARRWNF